jgi:site-specific DNA-methyltransferase (adenine-specific)
MNKHLSEVTNEDCMEGMARYPDNYFDLAIVDPPYGIDINKHRIKDKNIYNTGFNKYGASISNKKDYGNKDWDKNIPEINYFNELIRISNNQIIWGGNYFSFILPQSFGWIFWDKDTSGSDFADGEIAWTSFKKPVRKVFWRWNGLLQQDMKNKEERIHPTQKPVALYKWLLQNYAKQGDKILDTHLGSGSSRIAAYEMGFDFTGFELDKEYFEAQEKRYKAHIAQLKMELV